MKKILLYIITIICFIFNGSLTFASTLTFGNSEYFIVHSDGISWTKAKQIAEEAGGHLATITSKAENNFLKENLFKGQQKAYWLGAYQTGDKNRKSPASNWKWVTNEDWSYTDWEPTEPNNSGKVNEIHLSADSRYEFRWNDEGSAVSSMITGFVIEKEKTAAPTPLPGSILILVVGLTGIAGLRKKFKKI